MAMALDALRQAVPEQLGLVATMVRRRELFVPMMAIWVASFGGALHAPVTTFFLLELGASTAQLGNFGVINTVGALALSPVYGWLLDRHSPYIPAVLSAFCCSFGCLLRGFAPVGDAGFLYLSNVVLGLGAGNFWNVVGAYVALATPREHRSLAVSGFQVQVAALRLLGTSCYPAWDWALVKGGVQDKLLRFRIHMSVCSFFCIFGFFYMLVRFKPVVLAEYVAETRQEKRPDQPANKRQLVLILAALVVQSFGEVIVTVLWPLHIRKLGWDTHEYAYLQLASQLVVIAGTVGYPPLARSLGQRALASCLPVVACITSAIAFMQDEDDFYERTLHVCSVLSFLMICGVMKVCFQHLASLAVPPPMQGRLFSLLSMLASGGNILGNLVGTRLVNHDATSGHSVAPVFLASALFLFAGFAVAWLLIVPDNLDCLHRCHEGTDQVMETTSEDTGHSGPESGTTSITNASEGEAATVARGASNKVAAAPL